MLEKDGSRSPDLPPSCRTSVLPVVMTIAGSDSGGGAGIQADLKTFTALGVFGTTAITCVTAQNPSAVKAVSAVPASIVVDQISMINEAFRPAAAKTGMLYSADIITAVAKAVKGFKIRPLVVDPVMIATSGAHLLRSDAVGALCDELLPLATVITPNIQEAEFLADMEINTVPKMKIAAAAMGRRWRTAVVVKGGHLGGRTVVNVLYDRRTTSLIEHPRSRARSTHGTGCTFSAAIAALLAHGHPLREAVTGAGIFVARAVAGSLSVGKHHALRIGL